MLRPAIFMFLALSASLVLAADIPTKLAAELVTNLAAGLVVVWKIPKASLDCGAK